MAVQPALDANTWDLYLDANGDFAMVEDGLEVAQHVRQRLNTFLGEWPYDLNVGVSWYQDILGQPRLGSRSEDRAYAEAILRTEVLQTPGVTRLVTFNYSQNEQHRLATFNFSFDTLWGSTQGDQVFDIGLNR